MINKNKSLKEERKVDKKITHIDFESTIRKEMRKLIKYYKNLWRIN